jgi:hypothetical protein
MPFRLCHVCFVALTPNTQVKMHIKRAQDEISSAVDDEMAKEKIGISPATETSSDSGVYLTKTRCDVNSDPGEALLPQTTIRFVLPVCGTRLLILLCSEYGLNAAL